MATLLVVEDDVHQAGLLKQELEEEGYEIILAGDGHEALRKLGEHRIQVIILDIRMPNMDGIEMLRRLLLREVTIPVIIHTAYARHQNESITWAAEHYVVKSSDLGKLKSKIRESLELRRNTTPQKGWNRC